MALGHWLKDYIGPHSGGSGGGGTEPLIVNATIVGGDYVLDRTWQEIHDAFISGTVIIKDGNRIETVTNMDVQEFPPSSGNYKYVIGEYEADSTSDYPKVALSIIRIHSKMEIK